MASTGSNGEDGEGRARLVLEVDAVVFDCDGVLVDSGDSVDRCYRRWVEELGLGAEALALDIHGRTSLATAQTLLPPDQAEAGAARWEQIEIDDAASVLEVPGAGALLRSIPADRWAVVTSCTQPLFAGRRAAAGLPEPAIAVTAEDVARSKPDPEGYARALRLLGVDPSRAVVLEDAVAGLLAARAAGVRWVVRVGPGERLSIEDAVIADLRGVRWTGSLELTGDVWSAELTELS
jgi:mannitol-1-/sugar-/sorbitol-6-phosphatase